VEGPIAAGSSTATRLMPNGAAFDDAPLRPLGAPENNPPASISARTCADREASRWLPAGRFPGRCARIWWARPFAESARFVPYAELHAQVRARLAGLRVNSSHDAFSHTPQEAPRPNLAPPQLAPGNAVREAGRVSSGSSGCAGPFPISVEARRGPRARSRL